MISKKELEEAIQECKSLPATYQSCEKLATLFNVYDHLYAEQVQPVSLHRETQIVQQEVIHNPGDSEFCKLIDGKDAKKVWDVIEELMQTIEVVNSRLHTAVIMKLSEI